ncbi:MAG: sugar transferase [Bryobacteraceae bacterium]|nr:sugar transferase [Bryobacteraceae bacterium]MDW8379066.1 sugar transferase [Bryobacterales bacterium]
MIRLFSVFIPTTILGLLLSDILLVSAVFAVACYFTVESGLYLFLLAEAGLERLLVVLASIMLGLHFNDFYATTRIPSRLLIYQQVSLTIGTTLLLQAAIAYLNVSWRMPRKAMLLGSGACLVLLPAWRIFYSKVILRILGAERVLLVGSSPALTKLGLHMLEHPEVGLLPVGIVCQAPAPADFAHLGSLGQLSQILAEHKPSRLIVGLEPQEEQNLQGLFEARQQGILVEDVAKLYESILGRVCLSRLRPEDVAVGNELQPPSRNYLIHNLYSFLIGLIGLTLAAPIMLLVALAVRISSPGPILFRQTRVGLNNATFTLYKFRSMYQDAEARTGAVWAQANDPRVTPVGRWLRSLRLDELPQLFNVLRGEMAIVGPRPERPEFVKPLAEKIPFYLHRHLVKPGITGWAQINYRYGNTIEDTVVKLEYDLYYIRHMSLSLDLLIMFHTVKTMLLTRGAY